MGWKAGLLLAILVIGGCSPSSSTTRSATAIHFPFPPAVVTASSIPLPRGIYPPPSPILYFEAQGDPDGAWREINWDGELVGSVAFGTPTPRIVPSRSGAEFLRTVEASSAQPFLHYEGYRSDGAWIGDLVSKPTADVMWADDDRHVCALTYDQNSATAVYALWLAEPGRAPALVATLTSPQVSLRTPTGFSYTAPANPSLAACSIVRDRVVLGYGIYYHDPMANPTFAAWQMEVRSLSTGHVVLSRRYALGNPDTQVNLRLSGNAQTVALNAAGGTTLQDLVVGSVRTFMGMRTVALSQDGQTAVLVPIAGHGGVIEAWKAGQILARRGGALQVSGALIGAGGADAILVGDTGALDHLVLVEPGTSRELAVDVLAASYPCGCPGSDWT